MTIPITVCEVGPRDGLQNEARALAPATRAELVRRLAATGLPVIEAGSAVRDDRVPQMAGLEAVVRDAAPAQSPACELAVLVMNGRGLERALSTRAHGVHVAYPVTDAFARHNQGADAATAAVEARRIADEARAAGRSATITLAAALGCPFAGEVDPGLVAVRAAEAATSADVVVLADTIGAATPRALRALISAVRRATPVRLGVHLHNTRNAGYANAVAALEAGVDWFDASVGGFGGCPFAPGATGNVATEDLAWILEREGARPGLDLDALGAAGAWLGDQLGRPVPGLLHRAGPFPAAA